MHLTASASADVEEVGVVGQVWWWALLAVVVVVALLAVLLLRRRGRVEVLSEQTGIAAAAAGGVGGAVGAAGVAAAASRARHDDVRIDEREMPSPPSDGAEPTSVEVEAEAEAEQPPSAPGPTDSALASLDSGRAKSHTGPGASAVAAVAAAVTRPGPHERSVLPAADGSAPADEYTVKANEGSGKYYTHDSPFYVRTRADLWFRSPADAEKAGFAPWDSGQADREA